MDAARTHDADVAVIGGGASGLAAAIAAARAGWRTIAFAPPAPFPPGRTAALLHGSVDLLRSLDAWAGLEWDAALLVAIRIVDATRRLVRAPEVTFHAHEAGLAAFGFNVPNGRLVAELLGVLANERNASVIAEPIVRIEPDATGVLLATDSDEAWRARLVVGADGARSRAREAAGIAMRRRDYRQSALVTTLAVEVPHENVSTEFHTEHGPFTLVPLPGGRMSLVWVDRPETLGAAAEADEAAFDEQVERRTFSILGKVRVDSPRMVYPLSARLADRLAQRRTVLVGEAAHVLPPIGAQGLNLGFRDVAGLRDVLKRFRNDPGQDAALAAYEATRRADVNSRYLAVDLLNRSLLTAFLPAQILRGLGLAAARTFPALRRVLIQQGLAGGASASA